MGNSAPTDSTECSIADPCLLSDVEAHGGYGTGTSGDEVEIFITENVTATAALNLPSNTMLKSSGGTFQISGDGSFALVSIDAGASNVTIDGVDFDNGLSAIIAAAGASRTNITISNVMINSNAGAVDGDDDAIHLEDIDGLTLTNITVDDFGDDAVEIRNSSSITLNGLTATNPRIADSAALVAIGVAGGVGGSNWTDISYDGALLGVPHAKRGIVLELLSGTHNFIESAAPYTVRNIAVVGGDNVSGIGFYLSTRNVTADADITASNLTIQNIEGRYTSTGSFIASAPSLASGFYVQHGASHAQKVTIDGLTLEQTGGSQAVPRYAIWVTRSGGLLGDITIRILNSSLTSFHDYGIKMQGGQATNVALEVTNNIVTMSKIGGSYDSNQNEAIELAGCDATLSGRSQDISITGNQFSNTAHDTMRLLCSPIQTSRVNISNNSQVFGGFGGKVRGMHIIFGGSGLVADHDLTVENNNIIVSPDGGNTSSRRAVEVVVNSGNSAGSNICVRMNGNQSGTVADPRRLTISTLSGDTALNLRTAGTPATGGTLQQNMETSIANENTNESLVQVLNLPASGNSLSQGTCDQPVIP